LEEGQTESRHKVLFVREQTSAARDLHGLSHKLGQRFLWQGEDLVDGHARVDGLEVHVVHDQAHWNLAVHALLLCVHDRVVGAKPLHFLLTGLEV
jgi:hypothetical protein